MKRENKDNRAEKKEKIEMLSEYDIDNIWMSYRYCIGRHTIAAHCHAGDIASHAYGRMTDERTQFMSQDINSEIYDKLHWNNWFEIDNYWSIPKSELRPLDLLYQAINSFNITMDEFKNVKNIEAVYKNGKWEFFLYKYKSDNKNIRSIYDIDDLEIWQKLANLFDLNGHKWCECDGGKIVEYYEVWMIDNSSNEHLRYKKYKVPVDTKDRFTVLTYIDEQFIKKDNINPKDYEGKN